MPPRKKKRTSSAPAKAAEPDVVHTHLAGTMQEAAAAPHYVRLVGAGGLASPLYCVGVGETDNVEPADLLSAVEYALATPAATKKNVREGRQPTCEEKPFVAEREKLGEGAPASFLDGCLPGTAQKWRDNRWTPRELSIFLQTRLQIQELEGSRPKCCFCQAMLTYITSSAFQRALFREAYGPMWIADGDVVWVSRLLMEAAANRAARALRERGWSRTVVINPRTKDSEGVAKYVVISSTGPSDATLRKADSGMTPPKAKKKPASSSGTSSKKKKSTPEQFYANAKQAERYGVVGRAFADLSVELKPNGRLKADVELPGDDDTSSCPATTTSSRSRTPRTRCWRIWRAALLWIMGVSLSLWLCGAPFWANT
jgi:hypothetical protein